MDKLNSVLRLIAGAALFALWAALVFTGKVKPDDLVLAIGAALTGLGVFHATKTDPGTAVALVAGELASPGAAAARVEPSAPAPSEAPVIVTPGAPQQPTTH